MSKKKYENLGEVLRNMPKDRLASVLSQLSEEEATQILYDWSIWSRPQQRYNINTAADIELYMAGRGFGKTRLGSEALRHVVSEGVKDIVIVAPTSADLRETNVSGMSGVLSVFPPNDPNRPEYVPSKSRIEFPNGARVRLLSAEEADRGRGGNPQWVWYDELSSYKNPDIFHQVQLSLRIAPAKAIITTTPKATPLMIELSKRFGKDINVTYGSTYDNSANLSANYLRAVEAAYEGTRLGDQELHGRLLLTSEDALWNPELIDRCKVHESDLPKMVKYCIAVDPAASHGKKSDATGIVIVGMGEDDKLYILGDLTGKYSPQGWASKVIQNFDYLSRTAPTIIVVESNMGGEMATSTLTRERPFLPVKTVFHTANKLSRAEPIALLAEQGKIKHVVQAGLTDLEDELISYDGKSNTRSPNRLDAMVMACTHLAPVKKSFVVSREFLI